LRSTVVLPEDYGRWSSGTLDRVLLHELAHVQRRDCSAYLVGELARAIHWPNPLVWLALYRL
ncbi:MAG: energy transducer TonB, partial [Gemmatimonadetes bacterium]|nr:energy transducer TonB [Gemmatimonadota bacterium]NIT88007.1 energy transducer TonB [Gemmatimonadota bacterium]NIU31851.1 energy transducer TonB [Gemmatimonadota bacterium]NIV62213.1 energy transducer TonB [Gemmatimonadota bacterium]NIW64935.1 energy transducer TonB [Gemmatimonadota bacterium]